MFGYPQSVRASGYEDLARGVDWILAEFEYPGIGAVVVSGGWHHPKAFPFSMDYTVVSDGGTLEFSSAGVPLTLYGGDGTERKVATPDVDGYEDEIRYFVDCVCAGKAPEMCPPEQSAAAVQTGAAHGSIPKRKRREDRMQILRNMEIGVMFWAGRDPRETLRELKGLGVRCGQMGIPGDMDLKGAAAGWKRALEEENFTVVTVFCRLQRGGLRGRADRAADGGLDSPRHPRRTRSPHL